MDLKDILKSLSVEALTEEQQTEITTKLEDIISFKVNEQVNEALETEKERLVEEYEEKYEEYKQDITSKFSNFVDEVLEEEMVIPEQILEFARYGELYKELIEQIKIRVGIDEGVLDDEIRGLLKEAKEEILKLQDELNNEIERRLELETDAYDLALESYRQIKCGSVPSAQRNKVLVLLEGTKTRDEVDRKYDFIMENNLFDGIIEEEENPDGKGQHTLDEVKINKIDSIDENTKSPFKQDLSMWLNVLKNRE